MTEVEAVSWDITLGAATSGLGQLILGATSDSSDVIPEAMDHVGLKVFGSMYEYGDLGILKSELPEDDAKLRSKYPAFKLRIVEPLGTTPVTKDEFDAWVEEKNNSEFKGSCYDVIYNSCVVWARTACQFLQVPHPSNWDKVIQWAERNKAFTSVVGITGMGSRTVQHKATEYVTDPSKIKLKAKRLYRKIRRKRSIETSEGGISTKIATTVRSAGQVTLELSSHSEADELDDHDDDDYTGSESSDDDQNHSGRSSSTSKYSNNDNCNTSTSNKLQPDEAEGIKEAE